MLSHHYQIEVDSFCHLATIDKVALKLELSHPKMNQKKGKRLRQVNIN